jgi:chromosome segregation ATPase
MAADRCATGIKELFESETTELKEKITEQEKRADELTKAVQELSGKLLEREKEVTDLREGFEKHKQETDEAQKTSQARLDEDLKTVEAFRTKAEEDLKQVNEKVSDHEKRLGEWEFKMKSAEELFKTCTDRTDKLDDKLRTFTRQCEDMVARVTATETKMNDIEGLTATVAKAQQALEDSVTRKYETLWEDVLRAIDDSRGKIQGASEHQSSAAKDETKSMVTYALNCMSQAHGERRNQLLNKSLLNAWKEQTWNSARRNLGISCLHRIVVKRQRSMFDMWTRRHATNALCEKLTSQYDSQLSSVYRKVEEGDNVLHGRIIKLDKEVEYLTETKCNNVTLSESMDKVHRDLEERLKVIDPIHAELKQHASHLEKHVVEHRSHRDCHEAHNAKIDAIGKDLQDVMDNLPSKAKSEEVNGMIRDILLLWNSVKQMDYAKADKKDVDAFALETGNRDKLTQRGMEDLKDDVTKKTQQVSTQMQDKWTTVDGRLDEAARNFRHWEQMWEQLAGFVEDLVQKIGELQVHVGDSKLPATIRPGRLLSKKRLGDSRAETPQGHSVVDAQTKGPTDTTHVAPGATLESKMMWLNSAKGIVDATIDQAVTATPTSARPRPKSATLRRTYDRAR